jgi:5-formyltetrahydrofolate cyclo-ligase
MKGKFSTKEKARQAVWNAMVSEKVALFPFPPHRRIANFQGADAAAKRLFEIPELQKSEKFAIFIYQSSIA